MRPLTALAPARADFLRSLTCALAFGAAFWPGSAAAVCTWPTNSVFNPPYTNVIALAGGYCSLTSSNISFSAGPSAPAPPGGISVPTGVNYSGFGFIAYDGGRITVTGSNISITSYPGVVSGAPATAAYGVYSLGNGSSVSFSGSTTVTTTSDNAFGLYAAAGGSITATGPMTVTTSGAGASGVLADVTGRGSTFPDAPGLVTLSGGGSVTTSGADAYGLNATGSGSQITASGVAIVTGGAGSSGAQADTGGVLILTGGSVNTSGTGAVGVAAITGGSAAVNGVSISTSGQDAHALMVSGSGSQASLTGANGFVTQGNGAIGLYASQGGALSASGATTVTTSGGVSSATGLPAYGVNADGASSKIALAGPNAIVTQGSGAIGLYASRGGALSASGTTSVTTSGGGAYGVNADGAGSAVNLAAATVKTSGAGATGLLASDAKNSGAAGSIIVTGPLSVTTTNPAATAIGLQGDGASIAATGGGTIASAGGAIAFLGGTNQTATFDNVSITNQTGDLISADPSVATVNFIGVTANAGTNNLLNATNGSFVTLNASASTLTGAIQTDSTSTSTVNLANKSTWTMTGSSVLTNLAVANSYVVFAPPAGGVGFKTLTLSNYVGSGGFVTMNATLGGTGSPSDEIVINGGKATGSTLLTVRNVGGSGAQTTGAGIPVVVAVNGGTIAPNAFALANTLVAGGYAYSLEQNGQDLYLVSAPTTTAAQIANSITNVAKAQQQALITGRVLGSILLGATEQISCSNCSSGFGSIGSYALGAHGRTSLTPELTAMGGFSYDEYSAQGITVTNAATFAGSLVYDPINFGKSRPFFEIGGGFVPYEQIRYQRTYPYGDLVAEGQGNAINRSLGLFARVGWVDRVTPIDEAAVYTDISRSWLTAGGYTEAAAGNNPYPATVSTGLEALDVLRLGGQYTHLFGGKFEANVSAAVAYGFNSLNSAQWNVADYGLIAPYPIGNSVWYEWGARVGYRVSDRMVVDAFLLGTLGGQIGTTIHGGIGLRYLF